MILSFRTGTKDRHGESAGFRVGAWSFQSGEGAVVTPVAPLGPADRLALRIPIDDLAVRHRTDRLEFRAEPDIMVNR